MTYRRGLLPKIAMACMLLAGVSACDRVTVTELQPRQVGVREGGDPLVIFIGVHWTTGICEGQFTVRATESASQVRVDNVISREHSNANCVGVGAPPDGTAWVDVTLGAPLDEREVVRTSDGARLPGATLPRQ